MQTRLDATLPTTVTTLNAMHLAQLTAYAYGLPPLFFCSQYQTLPAQQIIEQCQQRLVQLLDNAEITPSQLDDLLTSKAYFDDEEARLRVGPLLTE